MDDKNVKTQFGLTVRKLRLSKNISQEKFAEIVGLHRTYISEVERGTRNVTLINVVKIAKGLEVKTSELFCEMEKEI
ncbi:helix-turn-helix domain-containing protein [Fredinandcohnia quinoae]|uniref:Helix-turn-helix transcriptional regulator n=1 Tax=Fredinandcohnia quinoae TaxID=2918902 RepID=A0AAW5DZN7_9BACI|nr:helix-turn-helix transcriptional regulator [Fredinandcohnia sp. SECRCQ15]MCH1626117.1 helix-turn-helix transcriptional regulator [Fredinandcohnia sp. SECRCQ15]